jgi:phosphopantothenate synthetase
MGFWERLKNSTFANKLKRIIPGFKGYYQQEDCRDSDQLIRKKIQEYLQRSVDELTSVMEQYHNKGNDELSSTVDNTINQINKFKNDVRNASYGFKPKSRFVTKTDTKDFDQIVKSDGAMIMVCEDLFNTASEISSNVILSDEEKNIKNELKLILKRIKKYFC